MARKAPDSRVVGVVRQSRAEKPGGSRAAWGRDPVITLSLQTSAARLLSNNPRARGFAVSKSQRRRMKSVDQVEFASLFHSFEDDYGDASARLVEQFRESYP